nr:hypothetical protein [Rhodococcus wratislaviensis]
MTTYASKIANAAATPRTTWRNVTFIAPPLPRRLLYYPVRPGSG